MLYMGICLWLLFLVEFVHAVGSFDWLLDWRLLCFCFVGLFVVDCFV